jgi:RimJ/RimL family protein N-acetyltransferase
MGRSGATSGTDHRGVTSVDDVLEHFGVKGMRWGVRNNKDAAGGGGSGGSAKVPKGDLVLTEKLKSGEQISIYRKPPPALGRFISKFSESYKKDTEAFSMFGMHDKDGKKVGEAAFVRDSKTSLYLDWIGIKAAHRGKGYASSALRGVVKYAQDEGITKLRLEVPTNAPDARHIYEKLGFKGGKSVVDPDDIAFGGLTEMSLDVPQKLKHADTTDDKWEEEFADEFAAFLSKHFSGTPVMKHEDPVEEFLVHFGVKGMRWGRRKKETGPASADAARKIVVKSKIKEGGLQTVSNKDLQDAINRMNLEQQFKRLSVNEKPAVGRFISSTLMEIGKREVQAKIAKTIAKKLATGGLG